MTVVALLAIGIIALAMLVMAVGVIFKNRCLRGSCGGVGVRGPAGEFLTCDTCPRRDEANCSNNPGLTHAADAERCAPAAETSSPQWTVHK